MTFNLGVNVATLRHVLKGPNVFLAMNNTMSNLCASSVFLNLSTFSLINKGISNKRLAVLGKTVPCVRMSSVSATSEEPVNEAAPKLTKNTAHTLVMKLTEEERTTLLNTLKEFESEQLKAQYKGQLAAFRWRTKFGRPSGVPRLGDVDPTGSYCPVPEDWLLKKYAETIPKPTGPQLLSVGIHNAIPFIGFGFLDNFLMIICGDSIELMLGSFVTISTMAAAALGNTFSDVLGLGCAGYIERLAAKTGIKPPSLSPIQLDMQSSRTCANIGRGLGVTIGCLLGMLPLLFLSKESGEKKDSETADASQETTN